ncbi:MAG: hypothetical protein L0Y55_04375, partial [Anaerolineales bacterium]|nr:hypothetical protein [Anaerolineales bacterium]
MLLHNLRSGASLFIVLILALVATACGSATPTSAPTIALPTLAVPPSVPAVPPSPVSSPAAGASAEPTKFAVAVSPEPAARATSTTAPAPKPSAPTGKIAYSVVTGREPKFFAIWVANANGSNPHQILTHALWPTFSPDGKQIAFYGRMEGRSEGLYIANSDGGGITGPL